VRFFVTPFLRLWFRPRISGAEHLPTDGPAVIAANHKSFLDAFFIGLATHRQVRSMVKAELFKGPLRWLLLRLGTFPVRRGEADADAMETARLILAQGGLVVIFPEGTRVDEVDALGSPHSGAGRLAVESGAPIIPAAVTGTSHLWLGPIPKPRRVQLAFLPPIDGADLPLTGDGGAALMERWVWPEVRSEYARLRGRPGLVLAALAALGIGGRWIARRRREAARKPRLLGKLKPRKVRRRKKARPWIRRVRRGARQRS
jgi:1-acyl-sn-glycerol-3-phosphate acyltransferase